MRSQEYRDSWSGLIFIIVADISKTMKSRQEDDCLQNLRYEWGMNYRGWTFKDVGCQVGFHLK